MSNPDQNQSVRKSATSMGTATLFSRVLGLMREQVFASLFGASLAADAFNVAFRIPNLLRDLFAEGAMSAAFVPEFSKATVKKGQAGEPPFTEAFRLLFAVLWILVVTVSTLSFLGMLFTAPIAEIYASSYKAVPGKFELVVSLTRIMFPFFPFVAMAAVIMGALNSLGYFFLPAFAPVLFNVASIFAGLLLCPWIEKHTHYPPIYGMAIGVVLGGFLQFYAQWLQIRKLGLKWKLFFEVFSRPFQVRGVKTVLLLLIPGTIGLASTQMGILINSIYATSAGAGAVSWMNYAFRLMQFPIGVFGVSLASATLPAIARKYANQDYKGVGFDLKKSLQLSFVVNGPAAAGLMAVGLPIVQMLFEHGRFSHFDSTQTASAVFWYALGLPFYSMVKILVPVFYALGKSRFPVIVSFFMVAINALLNHVCLFVLHFPFWSLALATSVSALGNALVLSLFLYRKYPQMFSFCFDRQFFITISKQVVISGAVGFFSYQTVELVDKLTKSMFFMTGFWIWSLEVFMAVGISFLVWLGIGKLLKIQEIEDSLIFFSKKLGRFKRIKV